MNQLGSVIKKMRLDKGLKANFVADKIGVDPSTLSKYESNERQIKADQLPAFAEVLGVNVEDFYAKNVGDKPITA